MSPDPAIERAHSGLRILSNTLLRTSQKAPNVHTKEFVECCDTILPFFDHLGPVFFVAKGEMQQKLEVLRSLVQDQPLLVDIVKADKAANKATIKNSPTRNLHRLAAAILFIKLLFERLLSARAAAEAAAAAGKPAAGDAGGITLREAAIYAYEASLAPIHTAIVKGVVRAGMLTLPSREAFMTSIGETEETAATVAKEVVDACQAVYSSVSCLLDDIDMPSSNVWLWPRS